MRAIWLALVCEGVVVLGCAPKPAPAVVTAGGPDEGTPAPVETAMDERTEAERTSAPRTPSPVATPSVGEVTPTPKADPVLVETVIWTAEAALAVDPYKIHSKDGVLRKNTPPLLADDAQQRFYPFAIDYWGLKGTKLEALLAPHVGGAVRVKGEFRKIYDGGKWVYEVDPVSITLLPSSSP